MGLKTRDLAFILLTVKLFSGIERGNALLNLISRVKGTSDSSVQKHDLTRAYLWKVLE